jgi:cell division protein FtsN
MERSYLEVKVSLVHIVVLLAGVILIGTFLFYLGYQAGKSSAKTQSLQAEKQKNEGKGEALQLGDASDTPATTAAPTTQPSINDELKLHQLPTNDTTPPTRNTTEPTPPPANKEPVTPPTTTKEAIPSKPIEKEAYFSVQVGAFSDYSNAKKYSTKFAAMGYPTEILSTAKKDKTIYRVRVGNFTTRQEAQTELAKLEKMENRKFAIINPS